MSHTHGTHGTLTHTAHNHTHTHAHTHTHTHTHITQHYCSVHSHAVIPVEALVQNALHSSGIKIKRVVKKRAQGASIGCCEVVVAVDRTVAALFLIRVFDTCGMEQRSGTLYRFGGFGPGAKKCPSYDTAFKGNTQT
jgi:hypothetical protein